MNKINKMRYAGMVKINVKCTTSFTLPLCFPSACEPNGIFHAQEERMKITKETLRTLQNVLSADSRLLCSLVNELFVCVSWCSSQFDRNILINCSYIVNVLTSVGNRRSVTLLVSIGNITKQLQRMHASLVSSVQVRWCFFL